MTGSILAWLEASWLVNALIVSTSGARELRRRLWLSVAERVLRKAERPVEPGGKE